ncbi:MAG: DNA polymerase III subunit alpha [Pelagibacteraceae bacterium]|jgi:DNA polymerase-3 subunit alpha|nr:DNA polymerase III subunit alpha [Pelagibacteraceae bacterium]
MKKPFIHLRSLSSYSLSESTLKIKKLVSLAKKNNMPALAITDNNNMFGVFEFAQECENNNIQPIIGTSISLLDIKGKEKISQLSFLVKNEIGYKNLIYLSSLSYLSKNSEVGISINDLEGHAEGLFCYIGGDLNPLMFLEKQNKDSDSFIKKLKKIFDINFLFELQRINDSEIDNFEDFLINKSNQYLIPIIGTNNIKFGDEGEFSAHDALLCVAQKTTINSGSRKTSNNQMGFKNNQEMKEIFHDIPEVIENNYNVAISCNYYPKEVPPKLPRFKNDLNLSENELLIKMSNVGLATKIKENKISDKKTYQDRLRYEIDIINKMGFAGYFLIVSDFVNWAKKNNIPVGPGRGSGAGSVTAWSLGITDLNPIKYSLLFERFLNPERISMPDFDIDFCQVRRDEVIEYVNKKYGSESVAHIITFGTMASRAAVRDIGRVLEVPYGEVDSFAKLIPFNPSNPLTLAESIKSEKSLRDIIDTDETLSNVVDISLKLEGVHRHASTHAAGVVIGDTSLSNVVPLYKDPNTETNATQFSMKYVEKAGLVKFDFLGLTTLSIINECVNLIHKENPEFVLNDIPLDDIKTFQQLSKGNAVGVFQLESNGMSSVLKQLQPDKFEEIIAVVALFRPGPMDNIPSFCNRKHGREEIDYIHPMLKEVLKETYGIIVYQEQVMQIAQVLSNYTLGEADLLRRAMGKKIQKEMDDQKIRFIEGALKNDISQNEASKIFDLVDKFAGYGFNKSHAAGYALISYQTAYLKANFPHEFMTATLNFSIDRTDKIISLKQELEKLGISFFKPDINYSNEKFSIEKKNKNKSIRFGLSAIKGVGEKSITSAIYVRKQNGNYKSVIDFLKRVESDVINKRQLEKLIQSGSFDSVEKNRSKLFSNVPQFVNLFGSNGIKADQNLLFEEEEISFSDKNLFEQNTPEWSSGEKLKNELEVVGFYFTDHPLKHYPYKFFELQNIEYFKEIDFDASIKKLRLCGSILDVKERSNKDGRKYAFVTVSEINSQYELSIFSENLSKFRYMLKEGNLLIFDIDLVMNNKEPRYIIKSIKKLENEFNDVNKNIKIFIQSENLLEFKDQLLSNKKSSRCNVSIFLNIDNKLISLKTDNNYSIKSYKQLDLLKSSKKLDYHIDIS